MRFSQWISCVDTHTEGNHTRIVTGGVGPISGKTMVEKMYFFKENYDHLRTALLAEPRGHRDTYGCILTEPCSKEADYGLIYMDNAEYESMCGHATIGVSTALVELGMIRMQEPWTRIVLEPPAGLVTVNVKCTNRRAEGVSFKNVPAYVDYIDADLEVPGLGKLKVDVAFGGNYFVFFSAEEVNLDIRPENMERINDTGLMIMEAANRQLPVQHPYLKHNSFINIATIVGKSKNPKAAYQNIHILKPRGHFDRSPGGTGTCARLAVLHAKGRLRMNEEIWAESITGGLFKGRLLEETKVGNKKAVIPEVTGCAYIIGFHQFVIDEDDRLKYGFLI